MRGQQFSPDVPLPFRAWLNQSWIDLAKPTTAENLTPWGIEFAYQAFVTGEDLPRFNSIVPTNHRLFVADVARSAGVTVAINAPGDVPEGERNERWARLCEAVASYGQMPADDRERLVWLLHRLCFHELVVNLTREAPPLGDANVLASLQVTRAIARSCLARSRGERLTGPLFQERWPEMPEGSPAAVEISYHMLIEHAKHRPDAARAADAARTHLRTVEAASPRLSEFKASLLWSRFYRVRAFVPMLSGDFDGMVRDMDLAENVALSLMPRTAVERYTAAEILWPVLESRIREAQVLRDLPLAERRARALVEAGRLNPRAWLHLGETLLALERYEDAIPVYREAHRLGPPASEVALFNIGQCYEMLDQAEPAMDAYAELLQLDPFAISAAERLAAIAASHGGRYQTWASAMLDSLSDMQAKQAKRAA